MASEEQKGGSGGSGSEEGKGERRHVRERSYSNQDICLDSPLCPKKPLLRKLIEINCPDVTIPYAVLIAGKLIEQENRIAKL